MIKQQYIDLSADEVMTVTDRILNTDHGTEDMACASYPLLLRLGSAYIEMLGAGKKEGTIPLALSEQEAWLMRSKILSADKMASDALFGVKLLCKLYAILLAYNVEVEIDANGVDDEFAGERKDALAKWVEANKQGGPKSDGSI